MKTLTLLQPETLDDEVLYIDKHYLGISLDSIVVLGITSKTSFSILQCIIKGNDDSAVVCEFDYMDDMLDVISIVLPVIRNKGHIYLEEHFNINL